MTDEGNPNSDWNPVWDVRTGRFEGGWTVEMAIPFKSLRYVSGAGPDLGHPDAPLHPPQERVDAPDALPAATGGVDQHLPGLARLRRWSASTCRRPAKNVELKPYAISRLTTDLTRTPAVDNDLQGRPAGSTPSTASPRT